MPGNDVLLRRKGVRPLQYLHYDTVSEAYLWGGDAGACVFSQQTAQAFIDHFGYQETHQAVPVAGNFLQLDDPQALELAQDAILHCWRHHHQEQIRRTASIVIERFQSAGYSAPSMKHLMMSFRTHTEANRAQDKYRKLLRWHEKMLIDTQQDGSQLTISQKQQLRLASQTKLLQSVAEIFSLLAKDWLIHCLVADQACKELLSETCSIQVDKVCESLTSDEADHQAGITEECVICLDAEPDHIYRPCMHRVACSSCAFELQTRSATCPWCRCELEKSS